MSSRVVALSAIAVIGLFAVIIAANRSIGSTQTLEFAVEGMRCESCAANLTKALRLQPGVQDATVSFEEKKARVTVSRWGGPDRSALHAVVTEAGYSTPRDAN